MQLSRAKPGNPASNLIKKAKRPAQSKENDR